MLDNLFCTTSLHVLFGLIIIIIIIIQHLYSALKPSTSYSIHFFIQSVSSFHNTCPYHRNLFCCSIHIISSIPSLSLNSLLGTLPFTLTPHIHYYPALLRHSTEHCDIMMMIKRADECVRVRVCVCVSLTGDMPAVNDGLTMRMTICTHAHTCTYGRQSESTSGYAAMVHGRGCNPHRCTTTFTNL